MSSKLITSKNVESVSVIKNNEVLLSLKESNCKVLAITVFSTDERIENVRLLEVSELMEMIQSPYVFFIKIKFKDMEGK